LVIEGIEWSCGWGCGFGAGLGGYLGGKVLNAVSDPPKAALAAFAVPLAALLIAPLIPLKSISPRSISKRVRLSSSFRRSNSRQNDTKCREFKRQREHWPGAFHIITPYAASFE
jgi:hypothetical protein